jgi:hypothetical protein
MDYVSILLAAIFCVGVLVLVALTMMPMNLCRSVVYLDDETRNDAVRVMGEADRYIDAWVLKNGKWRKARFILRELDEPLRRGEKQAGEVAPRARWYHLTWLWR